MALGQNSIPQVAQRGARVGLRISLLALFLLVVFARIPGVSQRAKTDTLVNEQKDGYVGSNVCATCHLGIFKHYVQTSMGRSMSEITPSLLQNLHVPAAYSDQRMNRHFYVYAEDGRLYQTESGTDAEAKESFRDTHQLQWIVGSGANVVGAIVKRGDYLFEAPLALYTKPMTWGPAPGYEFADYAFSRPILPGCIFCHSGRPQPVANTNGLFDKVPFSQLAIGCENCHGPGASHVRVMESSPDRRGKDLSIVNPARLTPDLANDICMGCHQIGDERVLKPGKSYQDFRPGTPLDNTLSILMVPPTRESPPRDDHLGHYYAMSLSKCYRASGGRLRCITCHDPHIEPSRQEAPAFFNRKCVTCHTDQDCKLPAAARQRSYPPDDCIQCHMPKRDEQFIAHSSLTNHRILAHPDESFPDAAFAATGSSPGLLHLNPVPGGEADSPPLLTLLQAYGELAAYKPEYVAPYLKVLDQLSKSEPGNSLVQAALGRRDLKNGRFQEAIDHLERALQLGPPQATVYADLSEALAKLGRKTDSITELETAIKLDPFNPIIQKTLVLRFVDLKQYSNAQATIERYLQIFPQDSFMRKMLALAKLNPQ